MSKTWVTRCPQCQTCFRLTRAQLQAANGSVRCGSCLHVFKATHHIVAQPEGSAPPVEKKPATAKTESRPPTPVQSPQPTAAPKSNDLELSDDFQNLDAWSPEATDSFDPNLERVDGKESADESWATQMLEDLEKEEQPPAPTKPKGNASASALSATSDSPDWGLDGAPDFSATDAATFDTAKQSSSADSFSGMRAERRALHELETEPLNLHMPEHSSWWKVLFYSAAIVVAGILLLAQYAWYDRENLARQDQLRPYYQIACERLNCELPDKINIQAIRGSNLVVRSHPRFENALVVDAIINNQAQYNQPFPAIQLTFSDLSGAIVASRRFKPDEYLSGELAGAQVMPSNTPIHLALEISDPGQKAVNYDLSFYPQP